MNIHRYHPDTGEYLGTGAADESPMEPGVFLIPAHATEVEPPQPQAGFMRRFVSGEWGYSPIEASETPPSEEPVVTTAMVNAERDRRIAAGFWFAGTSYDFDDRAKMNISGAAQLAFMAIVAGAQADDLFWNGGLSPFAWISADNSLATMDAPTVVEFGRAAAQHEQAHIFAARALKDLDPIPLDFRDDSYWP